jgi:hypothetical protein
MSDELVAELIENIERLVTNLERADVATGCCCCGDAIALHTWQSGHQAVDEGEYHRSQAIKAAEAAITKAKGEQNKA